MKVLEASIHDVTFIQLTTTVVALVSLLFLIPTSTDLLLIFMGYFLYSCIGVVIFYHRYWSHKSFKTWPIIETVGTVLGALAGRGSALSWATVHRLHHKHTDSDLDPHWSDRDGWKIFFPFLLTYNSQKINPFMIKDILSSKIVMFVPSNFRNVRSKISIIFLDFPRSYDSMVIKHICISKSSEQSACKQLVNLFTVMGRGLACVAS